MENLMLPMCSKKEMQAVDKIMKCIDSAARIEDLPVCYNMIQNYRKMYENKKAITVFTTLLNGYIMRKMKELDIPITFSNNENILTRSINLKEIIKNSI